jgi:hypothetical protein
MKEGEYYYYKDLKKINKNKKLFSFPLNKKDYKEAIYHYNIINKNFIENEINKIKLNNF